jgi:uncharacterized protein (TIGR03083 family)
MAFAWEDSRRAFAEAAGWFVDTTSLVRSDRWSHPGLGEWDVRALVGHTSRSLLTIETYLGRPAQAVDVPSAEEYFRVARTSGGSAIAARGRDAGEALGSDPAAAVAETSRRVLDLLSSLDGTELVTTIAGGMRLADYLPTRTFELAVHTADLASALGLPPAVPATAARQALRIVSDLAVADGVAGTLLLAATGRPGPPAGFSVL